jgi:hypothetical protein
MGICWYCYWGWSEPVAEIYIKALSKLNKDNSPLCFGPSHIVWEDENFGNDSIEWCLQELNSFENKYYERFTPEDLKVVKWSLEELMKVPLEIRCPEPEDYDDTNPELFPPKIKMVKI